MTDTDDTTTYSWDVDPEVLTLAADLAEMRTELDRYAATVTDLRTQLADGLSRETFLHETIAQLRTDLARAGTPATDHNGLHLAA